MKKQTSAVAIIVAVIFSILLFPFILVGGLSSGVVFSLESVIAPNREEDLYRSFADKGGMDFVYELVLQGMEEGMGEEAAEFGLKAEDFFPKSQVETIVYDVYHAFIKGEEYQLDLSYQKNILKEKLMEYFDANMEDELRAEYGAAYDLLNEEQKAAAIETVKVFYEAEIDSMIAEELGTLELELSEQFNSIYETEEFQELKNLEKQYGYSLTDRTQLCSDVRLAGDILLGLTGFVLVLLLLCHLFRPSGFFTAGGFSLVIGGFMLLLAKGVQNVLPGMISLEINEELNEAELPEFIMPMVEDVMDWCLTGFEKVGKIGLLTAVILILVGILLLVLRKNKTEAEPYSGVEMQ